MRTVSARRGRVGDSDCSGTRRHGVEIVNPAAVVGEPVESDVVGDAVGMRVLNKLDISEEPLLSPSYAVVCRCARTWI